VRCNVEPMTPEEAAGAVGRMQSSAAAHGVWDKVCNRCNAVVGGRLAEYGKPTEADLKHLACPSCGNSGAHGAKGFRVEFVPGV
jgi:hypothetical protein